jgi:hypothetical protein
VTSSVELFNLYLESHHISEFISLTYNTHSFWLQNCSLDFSSPLEIKPIAEYKIQKIYVKLDPSKSSKRDLDSLVSLFSALKKTGLSKSLKTVRLILHDFVPMTSTNVVKSRPKRGKIVPQAKPTDELSASVSDSFPNAVCLITKK